METPFRHTHYDVIIAGARVAGASTALLLARSGLRVLVVDPLPRGRDTLSTHALMRGAVLQLHRWGLLDRVRAAGTPEIPVTTFDYEDETIAVPVKERDGVGALFAPRRTVLDPIICEAAEEAGAEFVHGWVVKALDRAVGGRVQGAWVQRPGIAVQLTADLVVGADGARSSVARMVRAPVERTSRHTTASIYAYYEGLPDHEYRWYFRPGVAAGVIPTNGGEACVFVSLRPEVFHAERGRGLARIFADAVSRIDAELAERLNSTTRTSRLRAFPGATGFLRRSYGPGWALVGDAGYFRDPLTAHGMTDALRDAELLARAIAAGGDQALVEYQEARDAAAAGLFEVTDAIASLTWSNEEVKALHHRLSKEMNVGVDVVRSWDSPVDPGTRRSAA